MPHRNRAEAGKMKDFTLYHAAVAADNAWQSELERAYSKRAGDARYSSLGTATATLRKLWEAKHAADAEWRLYVYNSRKQAAR
jgi:hypothetical protein